MTEEQPGTEGTPQDATQQAGAEGAYDAAQDPDADPANLNPRTGAAAGEGTEAGTDDDTDADPANLNPRSTLDEAEE